MQIRLFNFFKVYKKKKKKNFWDCLEDVELRTTCNIPKYNKAENKTHSNCENNR